MPTSRRTEERDRGGDCASGAAAVRVDRECRPRATRPCMLAATARPVDQALTPGAAFSCAATHPARRTPATEEIHVMHIRASNTVDQGIGRSSGFADIPRPDLYLGAVAHDAIGFAYAADAEVLGAPLPGLRHPRRTRMRIHRARRSRDTDLFFEQRGTAASKGRLIPDLYYSLVCATRRALQSLAFGGPDASPRTRTPRVGSASTDRGGLSTQA